MDPLKKTLTQVWLIVAFLAASLIAVLIYIASQTGGF